MKDDDSRRILTMRKKMALTALGFGAAYLMRNKDARDKLSRQFDDFAQSPIRGEKSKNGASRSTQPHERKKGLLGSLFS